MAEVYIKPPNLLTSMQQAHLQNQHIPLIHT